MQLYRNAEMHLMSGEDIMKLGAINSVTDREIMKELTKDLRNLYTSQEIVDRILFWIHQIQSQTVYLKHRKGLTT